MHKEQKRLIKKYPNRRLYDTAISSYITLAQIRSLVLEDVPIQVIETRTEKDITHTILMQVIMELEEKNCHIFSSKVLQQIIRFYDDPFHKQLRHFIEHSLEVFVKQQPNFKEKVQDLLHLDQAEPNPDLIAFNLSNWESMQQHFLKNLEGKRVDQPGMPG